MKSSKIIFFLLSFWVCSFDFCLNVFAFASIPMSNNKVQPTVAKLSSLTQLIKENDNVNCLHGRNVQILKRRKKLAFPTRDTVNGSIQLGATMRGGSNDSNLEKERESIFSVSKIMQFTKKNYFLIGMFLAVGLARLFPALGKNGGILRSELLINNFGVTLIFLISGLSLEFSELTEAASRHKLNLSILFLTFLVWPLCIGLPVTTFLSNFLPNLLSKPLLDGILILSCLPTTVNMNIMLTTTAGGNVACSIWNSVVSNLLGIFITPALLFRFLGKSISLPFIDMVSKLCNKVLLPVAIGQALRTTDAKKIYNNNKKKFKYLQEFMLLGIVWNAFCNSFSSTASGIALHHSITMLLMIPFLHLVSLSGIFQFYNIKSLWKDDSLSRKDIVSAMFNASQKTLAFGLPMINTIFSGSPNLGAYCTPVMFVHPLQLIIGSFLIPKISKYVVEDQN